LKGPIFLKWRRFNQRLLKDRTFKNLTPPLGGEFQNLQVYGSGGVGVFYN